MGKGETTKECACTRKLQDLLRAAQPAKKSPLREVTCAGCGKVFWSDRERENCFECEAKRNK